MTRRKVGPTPITDAEVRDTLGWVLRTGKTCPNGDPRGEFTLQMT